MRNMAVLHSPAFSYPLPVLVRVLFNLLIFKGKILYYNKYGKNLQESHILDVILKYFYNSAICIFTAFAWWRKKQPVRFQPAVFLLNILKERMFLVISC